MSDRIVYFMRGLNCCGKSTRARELAGNSGKVIEVDAYFNIQTEDGVEYKFRRFDLNKARKHVYRELKRAMKLGISPIIIDRGNSPSAYTKRLMKRVITSGYTPKLAEPTSDLWKTLRRMMENKNSVDTKSFHEISQKISRLSEETHWVSSEKIFEKILRYPVNVTIDDFLNYDEEIANKINYIYEISDSD